MQSGELIVIGRDSVSVSLRGAPAEVCVYFEHDLEVIPCNPQHRDELEYEVLSDGIGDFILVISWSVTGVRGIKWKVSY